MNKVLVLIIIIVLIGGCKRGPQVNKFEFRGYGTTLEIQYVGEQNVNMETEIAAYNKKVEEDINYYGKNSFISKINATAHLAPVKVPHYACEMIEESIKWTRENEGKFDISYKSEGWLWDIHRAEVPNPDEVRKYLPLVGVDNIDIDCKADTVAYKKEGVKIDLNGFTDGWAADRTGEILRKYGYSNFLVNYGGDMFVCGSKGGTPWNVGIKNPLEEGKLLSNIYVGDNECKGIVTSGDYERFFQKDGKKYSHIVDPKTGYPVDGAHSVTVVSKNGTTSEVLTKSFSIGWKDADYRQRMINKFGVQVYTLTGKDLKYDEYGVK